MDKKNKNHAPLKKSVLNFLWILGVELKSINLGKLNCCFICSDENSYVAFGNNNFNSNQIDAVSVCNEELKRIFREALGEGNLISKKDGKN